MPRAGANANGLDSKVLQLSYRQMQLARTRMELLLDFLKPYSDESAWSMFARN